MVNNQFSFIDWLDNYQVLTFKLFAGLHELMEEGKLEIGKGNNRLLSSEVDFKTALLAPVIILSSIGRCLGSIAGKDSAKSTGRVLGSVGVVVTAAVVAPFFLLACMGQLAESAFKSISSFMFPQKEQSTSKFLKK